MIALTLLTTVLVALGGLMFQAARHTRQSAAVAYRSAAWDSIAGAVGCSSDSSGALAYDRCVTVQNVSAKLKRVTITITPTGTLTAAPDTIVISRVRPRPLSTLRSN
jgi:hypothetical protein